MKNIYSNIFKVNNNNLLKARKSLMTNGNIGVPTETVYGLAGNAYSNIAIKKIYNLKKRPKTNPLIIHYYNTKILKNDAILNKKFFILYKKFCPGPITFVLKKKAHTKISNLATAKLDSIAIRFPKNKVIRGLLKKLKFPLAIPSANKSGKISPVSSQDVVDEFGKKIKFILDNGCCKIGIESTVVDLRGKIKILRPGAISAKEIEKVIKLKIKNGSNKKIRSPGALKKHYSPGIKMVLNQKRSSKKAAFITYGHKFKDGDNTFNLSKNSNLNEAAKNLYKILRKIKKRKFKKIYVAKIPNKNIGIAINDRLKHASSK